MEAAPSVQVLAPPVRTRRSRRVALAVAPLVAATALPGVAHAQDYAYTGECSMYASTTSDGKRLYRQYRARFLKDANGSSWSMPGYDYSYTVDRGLKWGPHSDERVEYQTGNPSGADWHSPDDHTSNVAWVAERGWKGTGSKYGTSMKVHAWFDVPSSNDPECNVYTATF